MANTQVFVSKIDSSSTKIILLAENHLRKTALIYNNSTSNLYVKYGDDVSISLFTLCLGAGDYYELPMPCYAGIITGIWDSIDGNAMVTEIK